MVPRVGLKAPLWLPRYITSTFLRDEILGVRRCMSEVIWEWGWNLALRAKPRSPTTAGMVARQIDVSGGNPRGENSLFQGMEHSVQMCSAVNSKDSQRAKQRCVTGAFVYLAKLTCTLEKDKIMECAVCLSFRNNPESCFIFVSKL